MAAKTEETEVDLALSVRVPLRDGITLNATIYRPMNQRAAAPSILAMTPYVSDTHHDRAVYFAARGIPFVVVDVRGRGNSEGVFRPMIQEATDGHDAVEWLARQPFCNGKVAMWGGSYLGYIQWATAKTFPPHLVTIVPIAALYPGLDFPMRNNIFYPYAIQWLTTVSGLTSRQKIFSDQPFWLKAFRRWYESGRPFREIDGITGNTSPIFQEWLAHPEPDGYWDAHNPTADQYSRVQIPILTITGSYDDDQPGALEHYRQHLTHAGAAGALHHYLIIGPWNHAGTGTPQTQFDGINVSPASLINMSQLHLDWYLWVTQNAARPEFLKARVAYYVMGAEAWRYADSLGEITAHYLEYFLDSKSNANDVFSSGSLGTEPGSGDPDRYSYDPRDLAGIELDAEARSAGNTLTDQSLVLALREKHLVYHSAPLDCDVEISGFFELTAWIGINCPDTDFYVSIHEVATDGSTVRLSTDAVRARYREGLRSPKTIQTAAPLRYHFDRFTFVSKLIKRGHRLRLVIAPLGRIIDGSFWQRNPNTGAAVADEALEVARTVTVRLIHDKAHPSALYIPIGRAERHNECALATAAATSFVGVV